MDWLCRQSESEEARKMDKNKFISDFAQRNVRRSRQF